MKTACKSFTFLSLAASALALIFAVANTPAHAADNPGMAAPSPSTMNLADISPSMPVMTASSSPSGGSRPASIGPLEDKVVDSAKSVIKNLNNVDTVNLEDLNTARQAVVKLEVLIDIQKHINELEKLRNDKGMNGSASLANAIPASALAAPPMYSAARNNPMPAMNMVASSGGSGVSRILGADGHYTAQIGGKTVRVGDSTGEGTITAIDAHAVTTKSKDGVVHHLKVKGVEQVFGHTL